MKELRSGYENMEKSELVSLIRLQQSELVNQESVIKTYKKHLEEVIEYRSVEKYRESIKTNKGVAGTTPQND